MGRVQESLRRMQLATVAWMVEHRHSEIRRRYQEQAEELDLLVESIIVKVELAALFSEILSKFDPRMLRQAGNPPTPRFPITLDTTSEIRFEISSHGASLLARVAAFSGAVSACVNAADTLAQFLQRVYGIRLPSEPNMHHLTKAISPECLLSSVLSGNPGLGWMGRLRGLRAECQHGAVLRTFMANGEATASMPVVDAQWSADGTERLLVSDYVWRIRENAEMVLGMASDAVAARPETAVAPRRS